jgi:hypothetical protein
MKVKVIHYAWGLALASTIAFAVDACSSKSSGHPAGSPDAGGDSGTKVADSGTPPTDSGGGSKDSGMPSGDTGAPTGDSAAPPSDGGIVRGPVTLNFDPTGTGEPATIWWNDAEQVLYIADDISIPSQMWRWTDKSGFQMVAPIETSDAATAASDNQLDKLVQTPSGTLVAPRFGYGHYGAVVYVLADGGTGAVPDIDASVRRIGMAVDSNGNLWDDGFIKTATGTVGTISQLSLTTGETVYATGFQKPVGLLVVNGRILVSDQAINQILSVPTTGVGDGGLPDGAPYPVYASLQVPDQLALGPNGIIYTGQFLSSVDGGAPAIREIFPDGGVDILDAATGLTQPQDVAYDPTNKRLFVADSNGTTVRAIRIYPIN